MRKIIFVFFLSLIFDSAIYAQQGYWFQKHFIELESNNSSQYYVQLTDKDIPKVDKKSIIKGLVKCDSLLPVNNDGYLIKTAERPLGQNLYVSDLYHSSISDQIIILPSLSFEMIDNYANYHDGCVFIYYASNGEISLNTHCFTIFY